MAGFAQEENRLKEEAQRFEGLAAGLQEQNKLLGIAADWRRDRSIINPNPWITTSPLGVPGTRTLGGAPTQMGA